METTNIETVSNEQLTTGGDDVAVKLEAINKQLQAIADIQSRTVETVAKIQEMSITAPNQTKVEVVDNAELFVRETIAEYEANPNVKWRYPQDSRKFAVILKYVTEGLDIKQIAEYIR